ncbi:MAG TPA: phosphoribosylglycinamide formyltransferase [Rubricoccaceae bacterium]|nr:phosphoribosylglycinamide formyltransferase [Rubricoccaceae bacterium]
MRLAVFASGGGSNFQALLDAVDEGWLNAEPVLLVTDREGTGAAARAEAREIPIAVLPPAQFASEDAFAEALLRALEERGVEFIALAGYLKKIPAAIVRAYKHRMLNIHPALLPAFGGAGLYGLRVHQAVLDYGCRVSGATVHLVDDEYDSGPVVLQEVVPVLADDTPETLAARVLELEHRLYPEALQFFAEGRVTVEGRRVRILGDEENGEPADAPHPQALNE